MNIIYFYLALALALVAGLFYIYLPFKSVKKPKIDGLFTEALNAMVKGDRLIAARLLRDVVKQDSNHVRAYLQLGNILREENPEQATKIHQSLTVRPNLTSELKVDIHKALAIDYELLGKYRKSKTEAEQILIVEKRNTWALKFLINVAELEKNWDTAASRTRQLQKITGKSDKNDIARFEVLKGLDNFNKGHIKEAKIFFEKAIKISPDLGQAYQYLGDTYEQTRELVKSIENWKLFALKDLNNAHKVFEKIESALFDLGRYSEVENFYRRILKFDPNNFEAILCLANVLEEKGEEGAALTLVEESILSSGYDIRSDLMKLKLTLSTSTPLDLGQQIDKILEKLSRSENV